MGIGNTKIDKSALGALARKTIKKGNFNKFAGDFSKDISSKGLDGLANNIISAEKNKNNNELTK